MSSVKKRILALDRQSRIALVLIAASFALLWPGLTQPMLSLKISTQIDAGIANFQSDVFDKTRSILGTAKDLFADQKVFVAFLILFFSVCVPLAKGLLLAFALLGCEGSRRRKIIAWIHAISKWSMADVFLIGILIAFLSTHGQNQQQMHTLSALGMRIPVKLETALSSTLGGGFYFFTLYCLLSLALLHLIRNPQESA